MKKTYIDSNKHVRISGKTIVASDSITNLGVSIPILPQEIFSLITEDEGVLLGEDDCKCGRFGKYFKMILSDKNCKSIYIPPGFAHGFLAKTNDCEVLYKTTEYYFPEYEKTIIWDDPTLNIDWGIENPKLSNKDLNGKFFRDSYHFEN